MSSAVALLIASTLLIRTIVAMYTVHRGFDSTNVVTMRTLLTGPKHRKVQCGSRDHPQWARTYPLRTWRAERQRYMVLHTASGLRRYELRDSRAGALDADCRGRMVDRFPRILRRVQDPVEEGADIH